MGMLNTYLCHMQPDGTAQDRASGIRHGSRDPGGKKVNTVVVDAGVHE